MAARARIVIGALAASLVLALLPAEPAGAAGPIRIDRLDARAAIAGAAITIEGRGLRGRGTRVRVGGKRARVLSSKPRELRFQVPRTGPGRRRLVVKRRRRSDFTRFRVLRPSNGTIRAEVDASRTASGTIGPGGGEIEAVGSDGTRYTLRVPAGALSGDEAISVTPVTRLRGLPLTGGPAFAAELKPDGLEFASPATLEISARRRFRRHTLGFSYSSGEPGFEMQSPDRSGRVIRLEVEHFTVNGTGTANAADFANAIAAIIGNITGTLSIGQIERLIELMGVWEEDFGDPNANPPIFFCITQPVCEQAQQKARESLTVLAEQSCADGRALPLTALRLGAVRELNRIEGLRAALNEPTQITSACQQEILTPLHQAACAATTANPLEIYDDATAGVGGDLDGSGLLSNFEWLLFLAADASGGGLEDLGISAQNCALGALEGLTQDISLCETDRPRAEQRLRAGLRYAEALIFLIDEFRLAIEKCLITVEVLPVESVVDPGEQQQFTARVTNASEGDNSAVTWTAPGATIDQNGLWTAPSTPGTYSVKATSAINENRFGTATVTVEGGACDTVGSAFISDALAPPDGIAAAAVDAEQADVVQPGNVVIDDQADIDALRDGGITEITGNVTIGGNFAMSSPLTSLEGLEALQTIGGNLAIQNNDSLTSLIGLDGLRELGGFLTVQGNQELAEVDALAGLTGRRQGITVFDNASMTNVDGLCGTTEAGSLTIGSVPALASIDGLGGLGSIDSSLSLNLADSPIASLGGLSALESVGSTLDIRGTSLTSVDGLDSLRSVGNLMISNHPGVYGSLTEYRLPALEVVTGDVHVGGTDGSLTSLSLPALATVGVPGGPGVGSVTLSSTDLVVGAPLSNVLGDVNVFTSQVTQSAGHVHRDVKVSGIGAGSAGVNAGDVDRDVSIDSVSGGSVNVAVGALGRDIIVHRNTGGSATVTAQGTDRDVHVSLNSNIGLNINAGGTGRDVAFFCNRDVGFTGINPGGVGRRVVVQDNIGFDDEEALDWAEGISAPEDPIVSGNVEDDSGGEPDC